MTSLKLIGRYEVKSEIARGGMATVFHAYDPRFERDVAIKVLPMAFMHDPQFRVRFEREAKTIALLEHPAIVPVYDFGEEDGQPYIVMRYMSGETLNERIGQGAIPIEETVQIISRLAPALDAAHARNIVHRDLKPGNVLFDQYGNAYLSDFGIARIALEGSATLTGEAILGTPAYMSPEQVQGEKDLDWRSDIYAFGVLVYQMLTGQAPYQSDTPAKVMMMHILQPVPNILDSKADLPEGYSSVITKAMAKNPEDRYVSAGELAADLEAASRGITRNAPRSSTSETVLSDRSTRPDYQMTTMMTPGKTVLGSGGEAAEALHAGPDGYAQAIPGRRASYLTWFIPLLLVAILLVGSGSAMAVIGRQGRGPLAFLAPPTSTSAPTATTAPSPTSPPVEATKPAAGELPTQTPTMPESSPTIVAVASTEAPTEAPVSTGPVIGGADKMAYLNGKDIWVANLDGSELTQLTDDGTDKSKLQWTLDGEGVNYISGKCVYTVSLADKQKEIITCFNFAEFFKAFEISPDGKQIAVSIDNQLYILPNDLNVIRSISVRSDLSEAAQCKDFAPYLRNFVKYSRWSLDAQEMAMVIMGVATGIGSADTIQVIPVNECSANPKALDNFPPPRFTPEEYVAAPMLPNFGWDGRELFALATYIRNEGFGHLYVYNMGLKKPGEKIDPVNGTCCYRDPVWTPDGSHLLFAYQKYPGGDNSIQLYIIPYGTLGTGLEYSPIAIPDIQVKTIPQPVLRPAR
jgi:serine/threonine-protein kinase